MQFKFESLLLLLGSVSFLTLPPALAEQFKARVVSVSDGDSLTVMHDNAREKVILYGIDCPELKQDYGDLARQFTDQACYGKDVTIDEHGKDRRGRTIATVYLADGGNLNEELVKQGLAWWSDKFAPGDKVLKQYHEAARTKKIGLWSAANPTPPWIFRNGKKDVKAVVKTVRN